MINLCLNPASDNQFTDLVAISKLKELAKRLTKRNNLRKNKSKYSIKKMQTN